MARPARIFRRDGFDVEEFGEKNADGQLVSVDRYIVSRNGRHVCDIDRRFIAAWERLLPTIRRMAIDKAGE